MRTINMRTRSSSGRRERSRSPSREEQLDSLETSDLLVLYSFIHGNEIKYDSIGIQSDSFVEKIKSCTQDLGDRYYIVHIPSKEHWIVADFQVEGKKKLIHLYDPLTCSTTAPLTRKLRKIENVEVKMTKLSFQTDTWSCAYQCLWILLLLQNDLRLEKMPQVFIDICKWRLRNSDMETRKLNQAGDLLLSLFARKRHSVANMSLLLQECNE